MTFSIDLRNMSQAQQAKQNNNNINIDDNLRPAKQSKDVYKDSKVHEIYVSKFECDVTTEIVEQHILKNTDIPKDAFKIDEMRSIHKNENETTKHLK